MEADMLHSAGTALLVILDPIRLAYLFGGVCMGLALGILPGIGGVAGLALLLPFTYNLDAPAALALLLGLGSATTPADPISAILFGAPGHAASAATALDGYPMTKRGEAGRGPCASYLSGGVGGDFCRRHVGDDLRYFRRRLDGGSAADLAADHLVHGLARIAGDLRVRNFHGVVAVG